MATQGSAAVGVFETREQADLAIQDLLQHGFAENYIGFAMRRSDDAIVDDETTGVADDVEMAAEAAHEAAEGAVGGALAGAGIGGLIGAATALLLPGIGPILAGGILASAIGGAAIGAAAGGVLGALVEMGIPEEEARHYEREFHAGRALVTVNEPGRSHEALEILRRHGAVDTVNRDSEHHRAA
jgi:hypothetical protein